MRWKLIVGWALAAALLVGPALLPGAKTGAATPAAPTISAVVACDGTTWAVVYTLTSSSNAGYWVYPNGGQPNAGVVNGLPTSSGPGSVQFSVSGIPNGTSF